MSPTKKTSKIAEIPPSLLCRAQAWKGDSLSELETLIYDIEETYLFSRDPDITEDELDYEGFRAVLMELLSRNGLPLLIRAKLLVLMAATEEEVECKAIREQLEEASVCIVRVPRAATGEIVQVQCVEGNIWRLTRLLDAKMLYGGNS